MDRQMNELLRWSIQNSERGQVNGNGIEGPNGVNGAPPAAQHPPDTEAMNVLFGGPSDAELMKAAMAVITSDDALLQDKLIAFDNLEQLVESIDNANNLAPLDLWEPLIELLRSPEADLRRMAAWCCGTAVQNNTAAQVEVVDREALPLLASLALHDSEASVRRKAIYALSSAVRNHQPALDALVGVLPPTVLGEVGQGRLNASDMDAVDGIIERLNRHNS
ncbi:MAG: actin [Watsoniomyces obsoletus]|nr:MAG: actin [Watsoniomyces obsoletus]